MNEGVGIDVRFCYDQIVEFCTVLFQASGVERAAALTTAQRLADADFRGRTGHGLIRVVPYLERLREGGMNARPTMRLVRETPVSAQLDVDNGLGQVAMTWAAEIAGDKAAEQGLAMVGTVNSNHAGAAGLYPAMVAERGMVGVYFAVANANGMPPWGGNSPILGTNPISIAIPSVAGSPFLLDIATTVASHGTIKVARLAGEQMPIGWVVAPDGQPITDPARADEGFLVPIGGYKGSGLNIAIGLLAGVLNGAAFGSDVIDQRLDLRTPTNTGQLLIAFRVDLFRPLEEVLGDLAAHLSELRNSGSVDGQSVRMPGDRAADVLAANMREGLVIPEVVLSGLNMAAEHLGVSERLEDAKI